MLELIAQAGIGEARDVMVRRLKPREGSKTDPAHPCIHVVGVPKERLRKDVRDLYELICRRTLATFGTPMRVASQRITLNIEGNRFEIRGHRIIEHGWAELYGRFAKHEERPLPELRKGQRLAVSGVCVDERRTQPPPRHNPSSIVRELAKRNLGTKATRSQIVQTLYDRGYITGESIRVTELGLAVVDALRANCPDLISEELTRRFERELELVERMQVTVEEVLQGARTELARTFNALKSREREIGEVLVRALRAAKEKESERGSLGPCPSCGEGVLRMVKSKGGRWLVGHSSRQGCGRTYGLPREARLRVLKRKCKTCGLKLINVKRMNRKSWSLCVGVGSRSRNSLPRSKIIHKR
jgi:DNA topoisomerase-1